jgi:hypothetical protein
VLTLAFSEGESLLRADLGERVVGTGDWFDSDCSLNERDTPGHAPPFLEAMEKDVLTEKLAASNSP